MSTCFLNALINYAWNGYCPLILTVILLFIFRSNTFESICISTTAKEKAKIPYCIYQSSNIWIGKTFFVPKIFITRWSWWNRCRTRTLKRSGKLFLIFFLLNSALRSTLQILVAQTRKQTIRPYQFWRNIWLIGQILLAGHHLVPKSPSQVETWHGGNEKGCWIGKNSCNTQKLPRKCQWFRHIEKETNAWFNLISDATRQSRMNYMKSILIKLKLIGIFLLDLIFVETRNILNI